MGALLVGVNENATGVSRRYNPFVKPVESPSSFKLRCRQLVRLGHKYCRRTLRAVLRSTSVGPRALGRSQVEG
jgi:hypothetical protein